MQSSDHIETEWQFETAEPNRVINWLQSYPDGGEYLVSPVHVRLLEDAYFDTPDLRIARAGYTCRVRHVDGPISELTLKSMSDSQKGLRKRREVNQNITFFLDGSDPKILILAPGTCGDMLRTILGRKYQDLRALFYLKTARATYELHHFDCDGPIAEIAVDSVIVRSVIEQMMIAEELSGPSFYRVEVECPFTLALSQAFVEQLVKKNDLHAASRSKYEEAMKAIGHLDVPKFKLRKPDEVDSDMTSVEACYAIMRKQVKAIERNEPGTRLGENLIYLHDMRVATRRMRAAMGMFLPHLPHIFTVYREQIGKVAAALGEVRDLDVQIANFGSVGKGLEHLGAVEAILQKRRVLARKKLLTVLDSRWYEKLLLNLNKDLEREAPAVFGPLVRIEAPDMLNARYRKLRKQGKYVHSESPPVAYHALRIDSKKLRYALEFLAPLYGKNAQEFSGWTTELQDLLGAYQDSCTAISRLHSIAATEKLDAGTLLDIGALVERHRRAAEVQRDAFPEFFKHLSPRLWKFVLRDHPDWGIPWEDQTDPATIATPTR